MKVANVDGDKWRIVVFFNKDEKQPDSLKIKGKKWYKAAELKLRAKEKELWNQGFIYERKNYE